MESHKTRTSEGQQLIRELHCELVEFTAAAVPPDLTQDVVVQDAKSGMTRQEAKIESQIAGITSIQGDLEATQDSLNNKTWVQGVYVDDSIGEAIS